MIGLTSDSYFLLTGLCHRVGSILVSDPALQSGNDPRRESEFESRNRLHYIP